MLNYLRETAYGLRPIKYVHDYTDCTRVLTEAEEQDVHIKADSWRSASLDDSKTKMGALMWSAALGRPVTKSDIESTWGKHLSEKGQGDLGWRDACELVVVYLRRNSPVYPGAVDLVASSIQPKGHRGGPDDYHTSRSRGDHGSTIYKAYSGH